jgi:hypothetical protein
MVLSAGLTAADSASAAVNLSVLFNSTTNFAGITTWPTPPTVDTTTGAASPAAFMEVPENNLGDAIDGFSFSQSFTATTNGKLTQIQLPATGQITPEAPQSFQINVYDGLALDWSDIPIFDPDMDGGPNQYVPGTHVSADLLTDQTVQTWTGYTLQGATAAVLGVTLTGADQIDIVAGKTYIVEFELQADPVGALVLGRNGAGVGYNYTGGQAFRARKPLNGNSQRDFAMSFVIQAPESADFNGVNGVNGDDYNIWTGNFGQASGANHAGGDADGDGDVDGRDFLVWQRQFGTPPSLTAGAVVPEPSAVALAVVAIAATGLRRRQMP